LLEVTQPDAPICYGIVQPGPYVRDGVPVIAIRDLPRPSIRTLHRSSSRIEAAYQRSRVTDGDVLISVKGTTGRVGVVPEGFKGNISRDVARIRLRVEHDPGYWFQLLQSLEAQRTLRQATVGSTRQELSIGILKQLRFQFPGRPEQECIAAVLADVDDLIDTLERLIAKKQAIKQGMMQQLLTGQAASQWPEEEIRAFAFIGTGSKDTKDRASNGRYPFFVRSQKVERIDSWSFDGEAVLTAGDGVGTGKVFHYINGRFDYHQRVYRISDFRSDVSGRYFFHQFSRNFLARIESLTAKSSVDSVRMDTIAGMRIPLPNREEQDRIAEVIDNAESEIVALQTRLQKANAIKQGMMQELLTGRTRLHVHKEAA
jgi:type I restriction enzyme, S subunit